MNLLPFFTRRVTRGRYPSVWVAWVPGRGYSAEGDTEAEAVGELFLALAVERTISEDDVAELAACESASSSADERGAA